MYNLYVYYMLWGYWPVEQTLSYCLLMLYMVVTYLLLALPTEQSTLVFTTAKEPRENTN